MTDYDLVVRGGRVVTAAADGVTDVAVRDGKVVALGTRLSGTVEREVDATGKLVLPGGFDAHVHFTPVSLPDRSLAWADDYRTGTAAAAAGGVTSIGDIAFTHPGEHLAEGLNRVARTAQESALVDFMLHPVMVDPSPERIAEVPTLAAAGATSLKVFMHMAGFDQRLADYLAAFRAAGEADLLTMVHCEDRGVIDHCTQRLVAAGDTGLAHFPETRPVASESSAVERAIAYAEVTGGQIYIVHLSSRAALDAAARARSRGVPVYVETRPIYLHFTRERFDGPEPALYVGNPPLRQDDDVDALWTGLATGTVSTCCTDHAPWSRADKLDPALDVAHTRPGMADLETLMPSLFSNGVRTGRLSLQRFVEVTSANAARLFGVYPQKGTIAVGSDADLVVWDPELTRTVVGAELETAAKFSLFDGVALTGWPVLTFSRGDLVAEASRAVAQPGRGRRLTRTGSATTWSSTSGGPVL
jgi:dihydropyrimidinase